MGVSSGLIAAACLAAWQQPGGTKLGGGLEGYREAPSKYGFVGVGSDFPVMIGIEASAAPLQYFEPSLGLGFTPGPYVDFITGLIKNKKTARAIEQSLDSMVAVQARVRSRPTRYGAFAEVGFTLLTLAGGLQGTQELRAAGAPIPKEIEQPEAEVEVSSTLTLLDVGAGWRFLTDPWAIKLRVGYFWTLATSITVRDHNVDLSMLPEEDREAVRKQMNEGVHDWLDKQYRRNVNGATLGATVSYAF